MFRKNLSRSLRLGVATVAACSAAALLGRWHWALDLFSHFVAHYALFAAFASIGLLLCGKRGWAVVSVVILAVQIIQLTPYFPSRSSSSVNVASFKVFQFNVGALDGTYHALPSWIENRAEELDVVVLFEVDNSWERPIRRLAELFSASAFELRDDPYGIAVFTRLPGASAHIERTASYHPPSAMLTVAGNSAWPPMTILASHPPAPIGSIEWTARNSQLAALADVAVSQVGEVVLVGDLNTTIWSAWYRDLKRRSGLRDATAGHGYRATWAPYQLPLVLGFPLDQLLISPGLVSIDREYPPRMSSDHRPIVTTLAVRSHRN